jgi:hypothetical protein
MQGTGPRVARLRAPPAAVQYSSNVNNVESGSLFSAHTVDPQGRRKKREQLTFPLQCACTSCGPCCAAFAREGVLLTATYTFSGAPTAQQGDRITLKSVPRCHEMFCKHVGACSGSLGHGAEPSGGSQQAAGDDPGGRQEGVVVAGLGSEQEAAGGGQGEGERWLDLCLPARHPAEQRPLLEGTILVVHDDSGAPEAAAQGACQSRIV